MGKKKGQGRNKKKISLTKKKRREERCGVQRECFPVPERNSARREEERNGGLYEASK